MNHANVNSNTMDLHRRIALVLRKEPGLVRDFAQGLRSKLVTARPPAVVSDFEWEWYIILTLWSPLQVIRLLEDSSEQAVRLSPKLSICFFVTCPTGLSPRRIIREELPANVNLPYVSG